ncbi:MAG: glutamate-1-semialdehyde 2,1-aminomutase [Gammaproteobacteria bacterium]|nr:glutamate-1-semialdehyde 2,1-aminomutase [Gammaproteobacteria bacterium]MDP2348172.1 glutamate-1-semialdehyde 2,1-aminomutase [Gammaproteobacteria bacterium]
MSAFASNPDKKVSRSAALFEEAQRYIPGGVNSPVRAFRGVGGNPLFFQGGEGAWLIDEDENRYIDYVGAWGPLILGHRHPAVIEALQKQLTHGLGYGASTEAEITIARTICTLVPSIERVRLVTSGTEATMSAIRVARGYTRRDKVVKFEGCYHGHVDGLLVKAGSGALTLGEPDSLGVPKSYTDQTYVLPYNDVDALEKLFAANGKDIACIIVEPVAGNMNCVPPLPDYLQALRDVCDQYGSVLIFDEVMTGFRVALGGAQSVYNVTPDLTTLGKVIGGGLPVGAFGGRRDIMEMIAPMGPVYQAGTLAGSPLAVAAGMAMLNEIQKPDFYTLLTQRTSTLMKGLQDRADAAKISFTTNQVGGMFGCFFTNEAKISTFEQVMACDVERFRKYFHVMLNNGVYLAPSAFEAGFVSAAHGEEEIQLTLNAAERAFAAL